MLLLSWAGQKQRGGGLKFTEFPYQPAGALCAPKRVKKAWLKGEARPLQCLLIHGMNETAQEALGFVVVRFSKVVEKV